MSEELKPCPFCGGEAKHNEGGDSTYGRFWWSVGCPSCGLALHDREVWRKDGSGLLDGNYPPKECMKRWNTRATPTVERIDGLYDAISFEDLPMPETEEELKRYERRHKDHRDIYGQEIHETIEKAARAYLKLMEKKNVRRKMEIAKRPPDQQQRDGCV